MVKAGIIWPLRTAFVVMEPVLKTRLLGAAVLVVLAVLFVPMFFSSNPPTNGGDQSVSLAIPPAPDRDLQTKTMSLTPGNAAPSAAATSAPAPVATPLPSAAPTPMPVPSAQVPAAGTPQQPLVPVRTPGGTNQLSTVNIGSNRPRDVENDPN